MMLLSHLHQMINNLYYSFHQRSPSSQEVSANENNHRPSPLLVHVPINVTMTTSSIKNQLLVVKYNDFLEKMKESCSKVREKSRVCVVCMNFMEEGDEVRELGSCCHVFHRECIDGWIDQGQVSCPLCRSKLVLSEDDEGDDEHLKGSSSDPWRRERMIYLFGEDYSFDM